MFVLSEPDVGPICLEGQPRHMWSSRAPDAIEIDQVFLQVERCLDKFTVAVPMAEIEDLPVAY